MPDPTDRRPEGAAPPDVPAPGPAEAGANLLGAETSPYLLQHAGNPVHWRPWGPEALAAARESGRPILLSVGYAACHWCHVMAHESFEDPATAALMNRLYVCIKVDREERPEIDALYMNALHLLGEQGGWPLTMFLTPEGAPFWGGTYFPPEPRWGRPSFAQVLEGVAGAHARDGAAVARNVAALRDGLARMAASHPGPLPAGPQFEQVALGLVRATDPAEGGLAGAPKFPNPPVFRFLWQMRHRLGRPACGQVVDLLLRRMAQGGIWDHLGGGFARYSVDAIWLVPHFEKMLYDNAQLLELLALLQADRPDPLWEARAAELADWLAREMVAEGGAFAATQDADTEGEEGRFYVWTAAEVDALLGPDAPLFRRAYDVAGGGNWEGHAILNRRAHPEPLAPADEAALARARAVLFAARARRPAPARDDKVLADWNGLMVAALARAAAVFGRPDWLALARRAHDAVAGLLATPDGRLRHAWRHGRPAAAGLLDDHAAMARGALALHGATGEARFLDQAVGWAGACDRWFAAEGGGYHLSASDAADVPVRGRAAGDNATPSGNGLLAEVQARLWHLTGEARWRAACEATVGAFTGQERALPTLPTLLAAADLLERGATVVVTGAGDDPARAALLAAALRAPDPTVSVLRAAGAAALPPGHPAHGKAGPGGAPAAFVCRGGACSLPVADPAALAALLAPPADPARDASPPGA